MHGSNSSGCIRQFRSNGVLEEHVRGCVTDAIRDQRGDEAISELMTVLGKAMRR